MCSSCERVENDGGCDEPLRMPVSTATVLDGLVLERGPLRVEIAQHPFCIHVRRDGRRLVRALGLFAVEGEVQDQFIQFTEGVIAAEQLDLPERVVAVSMAEPLADGAQLAVRCEGERERRGSLRITLPEDETVLLELEFDGEPLRVAAPANRDMSPSFDTMPSALIPEPAMLTRFASTSRTIVETPLPHPPDLNRAFFQVYRI